MINWLRKKLGLCVHEYGEPVHYVFPGGTYKMVGNPQVTMQMNSRDFWFRFCNHCPKYIQVYKEKRT